MSIATLHSTGVFPRRRRVLAQHLSALLPRDARSILDVGCGDGSLAAQVVASRPGIQLRGIDVLVRPETAIPVEVFDGRTIPAADESEDVVMFVDVLHHTADPRVLLREAARVSRRWVLIKDHCRDGLLAGPTLRFMDWVGNAHHGVALPYNYWPEAKWQAAFADIGLDPVETRRDIGLYPAWANWWFGRGLHLITLLEKRGR